MIKKHLDGEDVFVIEGFLSESECDHLIARSEAMGYEAAAVGDAIIPAMRNNARVILDDPALAEALWSRSKSLVPGRVDGWEAVGLNERFRFYRYDAAEAFAPHYDAGLLTVSFWADTRRPRR